MAELKLSSENQIIDLPDLNRFRIGDHVVADACQDCDHHEGVIVGIEFQRLHGSECLVPSITLLHDGYLTDGFRPMHLRRTASPANQSIRELEEEVKRLREALDTIATSFHGSNPSMAYADAPREDYLEHVLMEARRFARSALHPQGQGEGS